MRILDAGIFQPDEKFELIDGELVAMESKGNWHELVKSELTMYWARRLPEDIMFAVEPALRLGAYDEPEPDIILFPASLTVNAVRGGTVLLVVEISDTSIGFDLSGKASLYASFGVREYWVIEPRKRVTHIHRNPQPDGYGSVVKVTAKRRVEPLAAPSLGLCLDDLRRE